MHKMEAEDNSIPTMDYGMSVEEMDKIMAEDMFDDGDLEGLEAISAAEEQVASPDPDAPGEETAQRLTADMEGVWFDGARGGVAIGKLIQEEAQARGWTGIADNDPESDGFWDAVNEAEEYMNELAPDGYYFSNTDGGDWGMFALESDDEVVKPAASPEQMVNAAEESSDEDLSEEEKKKLADLAKEEDDEFEKAEEEETSQPEKKSDKREYNKKTELNERMPDIKKRWQEEPLAPDTEVGFFSIAITPPAGSPFKAKNLNFLVAAPPEQVVELAQERLQDLQREWQGLEPEMSVVFTEEPVLISDSDVVGNPAASDENLDNVELGEYTDVDMRDMDWARQHPGTIVSTEAPTGKMVHELGGGRAPGSGRGVLSSLQLKNGQLFWAADDTIPQKPLPAGYRWVKVGDSYVQMKDDEAATLASVVALKNVTIASEFRDNLYPIKAQEIKEGDRVYVRPMMRMATVVDIKDGRYTVEAKNKLAVYWLSELEAR